jgi:hypothetical protein
MAMNLLTHNQQRRMATHLRLLLDDLTALADLPELAEASSAGVALADAAGELPER